MSLQSIYFPMYFVSFFKSTQSKFWWFWRHHYLKSVSQGTVNIFLVCVTRLCFTSHESVVRLGRGHSFDESTSRLFLLLSFKDNICSVAVFRKLHQIDWIKTVYLFFMHNWAFRKRRNNQSGLSRSCWFCKPTRCGLYKSKIRSLESYLNFPNYPNRNSTGR